MTTRPLYEIAAEALHDWKTQKGGVNFAAKPYLGAMLSLRTLDDMYGADTAEYVVRYFLCNVGTWRGETAKRIKAELREMVK